MGTKSLFSSKLILMSLEALHVTPALVLALSLVYFEKSTLVCIEETDHRGKELTVLPESEKQTHI